MDRFKAEHPICYFCATNPTASEDHVPSRECFVGRVGPEGFSFPACVRCNNTAGNFEQVVALYLLLSDQSDREIDDGQLRRLVLGVKNNSPSLMPAVISNARAARDHYRANGMRLAPGMTYNEVGLLEMPKGNRVAMELFARRLTCALYYKEVCRPIPLNYLIGTAWIANASPKSKEVEQQALELFPALRTTNRRNTDIGNQFAYLWGFHPETGLFGFTAQLAGSFIVFGACVPPEMAKGEAHWKPHSEDITLIDSLIAAKAASSE